ncbi:hypothetical protein CERSUDRAFT_112986 [Gelatoporia subvermispora B]|uniref:Uncharacterized protein n=1 Tax=Ceriporiopsis subvermispora (strain B) TaxID=914234 RepID=M2RKJ5_CERS8|nr:hypothetical protein CERSUDRAFT_112986 [Gelatoporia subvermispora B]
MFLAVVVLVTFLLGTPALLATEPGAVAAAVALNPGDYNARLQQDSQRCVMPSHTATLSAWSGYVSTGEEGVGRFSVSVLRRRSGPARRL